MALVRAPNIPVTVMPILYGLLNRWAPLPKPLPADRAGGSSSVRKIELAPNIPVARLLGVVPVVLSETCSGSPGCCSTWTASPSWCLMAAAYFIAHVIPGHDAAPT